MDVRIETSWQQLLNGEFERFYFEQLAEKVRAAYSTHRVFPPAQWIFRAFDACPVEQVKVVILGQDPYHGWGQAEGWAFSVPPGVTVPPSLRNILQEVANSTGKPSQIVGGHLAPWVSQGVLLLNSTLTVEEGKPCSHEGIGWQTFTDKAIESLAQARQGLVFMLWGSYARRKRGLIPEGKHLVLEAPHPSPLSAHRGFLGCNHFALANQYLAEQGKDPIIW